jgi:hypothetical protein
MILRSLCLLALGVGLVPIPGAAAPPSRVERPGTVGLGVAGGYGIVTGNSRFGSEFDDGWGLDFYLKYVVNAHWSLGLGFQSQMYESTTQAFNQGLDKLQMTGIRGDIFFYRDRAQDASQYLVLGVGIYRPEIHYTAEDVGFPGESAELSLGLGAEIFIGESWGLELGGRAISYFGDGQSPEDEAAGAEPFDSNVSLAFRGQAGLFFYILR